MTTLVWFRNDLRVADNPALSEACEHDRVVACFVVSSVQWRDHDVGERRLAFLGRSLNALSVELAKLSIPIELIEAPSFGDVPGALLALAERTGALRLVFNAEYPGDKAKASVLAESQCDAARDLGIRTVFLPLDLDGSWRLSCG